ncbi:TPA_asm: protein 4 [Zea virus 1]|uniref:Protein 4 n=1 Tax=Zea virus 1 TaxID=2977999 RepID=A0A9N7AAU2_9RHAB|nr:TPA_asm: protein 4 [Zea virus 1]
MTTYSAFDDVCVKTELVMMLQECRCMIQDNPYEVSPDDIYHYLELQKAVDTRINVSECICFYCSQENPREGRYIVKDDIKKVCDIIGEDRPEIPRILTVFPDSMTMCTECFLCALISREPMRLLLSVVTMCSNIYNNMTPLKRAYRRIGFNHGDYDDD